MRVMREQPRAATAPFPGPIHDQPFSPMGGDDRFVDIAHWTDLTEHGAGD